jgi:modulator of FtsH protease HflC
MSRSIIFSLVAGFFGLILISSSFFTVSEVQQAIVLQLGQPKRIEKTPGLKLKIPFLENVVYMDKRVLDLDMPAQEVLSTDQLRLTVDAFARFKIVDPLKAATSVVNEDGARAALSGILASKLRDELGEQRFDRLLSPERGELMDLIQANVNKEAAAIGTQIVDVRIKRADLPAGDALSSAFERMKTAREQEARAIRANGQKAAQIIRADADSQAAKIYADSFGKDAQFFAFYRSMQAYRESMRKEDTTIVLSPDSEFLRQFEGR